MHLAEDCIFCKIIKGEIPCSKIYEDETTFAFLDINPFAWGHCLVIAKDHTQNILEFDLSLSQNIFATIQKVACAVMQATQAEGFHVLQNNFPAAGQTVFHAHWHIVPRIEGDGLKLWSQSNYENQNALQSMAKNIIMCIN